MQKNKNTLKCHSEGNFVRAGNRLPHKVPFRMTSRCFGMIISAKNYQIFVLLLLIISNGFLFAQSYTVSGYVIDDETGETLIGVNIIVMEHNKGAATDNNGFFWIPELSPGEYQLEFSYVGYETYEFNIVIENESQILDEIVLKPKKLQTDFMPLPDNSN